MLVLFCVSLLLLQFCCFSLCVDVVVVVVLDVVVVVVLVVCLCVCVCCRLLVWLFVCSLARLIE